MFSLSFFTYFSYLFLLLCVGVFGVMGYISSSPPPVSLYFIVLFLLFPLIESLVDTLKRDSDTALSQKNTLLHDGIFLFCILSGFALLWAGGQYNLLVYLLFFAFMILLASWDTKIFFAIALVLLCYVIISLALGLQSQAELLSLYLYYCLILGVVGQALQQFRFFKT